MDAVTGMRDEQGRQPRQVVFAAMASGERLLGCRASIPRKNPATAPRKAWRIAFSWPWLAMARWATAAPAALRTR